MSVTELPEREAGFALLSQLFRILQERFVDVRTMTWSTESGLLGSRLDCGGQMTLDDVDAIIQWEAALRMCGISPEFCHVSFPESGAAVCVVLSWGGVAS